MKTIVCFGDSITACRNFPENRRWTLLVQNALDAAAPGGFEVYNRGAGGNTSLQGLERFEADVQPFLPATVLIEFGFNDAHIPAPRHLSRCSPTAFREALTEIVRLVRAGKGKPVLIANHPVRNEMAHLVQGNGRAYRQNFKPYQAAIRELAARLRVPLIDLECEMRAARVNEADLLAQDGLHLSAAGNEIYASFILKGLRPLLGLERKATAKGRAARSARLG